MTPAMTNVVETARRSPRAGFTLLELLIAITIIAVLAGLILTVAGGVSVRAKNTQVAVDIQDLAKSISLFKQKFGIEPPSRIVLYETVAGWTNSADPDAARSSGLIRRMWGQFDFTAARDINGDGDMVDTITLTGAECLVFFLGGVPDLTAKGGMPLGFSLNPADPFSRVGTNRDRFHDFQANRLVDVDGDGMKEVVDPLANQLKPYLYFSSYDGRGYDVANELPVSASFGGGPFVDVYRQGPNGFGTPSPSVPWNANSFQIISPGADQLYGVGGEYNPDTADGMLIGNRMPERDNIVNFGRSGPLAP